MNDRDTNLSRTVTTNVIEGPSEFEMPLRHQAFVPFHNLWGVNSCFLRGPFDLDIETLEAGCTSGSPVVASGQRMAGFLRFGPGRVRCPDGKTIRFEIPEGQTLIHLAGGTEREQWACSNAAVEAPAPAPRPRQTFWSLPEYVMEYDDDLGDAPVCRLRGLIDGDWKLVLYGGFDDGVLFNLADDPRELRNLWNEPKAQGRKAALLARLVQRLAQTDRFDSRRYCGA